MSRFDQFVESSQKTAFDREQQARLQHSLNNYRQQHEVGKQQFSDLELVKSKAAYARWKALENLDKYLIEFENNLYKRGGKVIWAPDAASALQEIDQLLQPYAGTSVVLGKSMVALEIGIEEHLKKKNTEVVETDLGEYIVQQAGEKPFHPVSPAMHKSVEDIASVLKSEQAVNSPESLSRLACDRIREVYGRARVGITGANFLLADTGGVVITENEGNARLAASAVQLHIVVTGIEKILPSINNLEYMLPLLSTYGSGQKLTAYNSIISGPRQADETDGPREMVVILLDNGRSDLLALQEQRQSLQCIRCGACHNVCPVFKTIGGHNYNSTYNGPIGAVISPQMGDMKELKHLSHASTLCGACTDVCPVNISLHKHLLANRRDAVDQGLAKSSEKMMWFAWKKAMLDRKKMNKGASMKNFFIRTLFKKAWGQKRLFPELAPKSFNELWKEQHPEG